MSENKLEGIDRMKKGFFRVSECRCRFEGECECVERDTGRGEAGSLVVLATYPLAGEEVIGAQPTVSKDQHFSPECG